ncbi:hypothetical protein GW916_09330 [bacterium]|nr:hypothetical protein [bacterium]
MITVSALSISGLPALFEKISQLKAKYPQHTIDFDTPHLNNPQHLSILILPSSFERYLEESIEVLTKNNFPMGHIAKVARILTLWRAERYRGTKRFRMRRDFKRMIEEHDRRRKTDFKNTFPEYVSFLNWITDPKWIPLF